MDFELSDDQIALREAAAALLGGRCSIGRVREVAAGASHFDDALWNAMADQGWLAVERSESEGGLGLGMVEVVVLCEELGRHLAPVPFLGTVLCAGALQRAVGAGEVSDDALVGERSVGEWARRLSSGETIGAIAWSADRAALSARRDVGGEWSLAGRSDPVVYGALADLVVVLAETSEGSALFAMAQDASIRPGAEPAMDITRSLAWLDLDDRPALRLGAAQAADQLLDRAATGASAEMLGAAEWALEATVSYAKDRVQFGRPIGSFQAVKHRCADMLVDVEGMRSSAYYAGWAVGADDPEAQSAASAAKVWCSDAAGRVMASALQVHGGIGFTWEHDMHLFLKRSQLDQMSFGGAAFHRERLARTLRRRAEAGLPVL